MCRAAMYTQSLRIVTVLCVFVITQGWCVLEACYTAPACPLVGGPVVLCLAWKCVTLMTVPRGVAARTAAIMMMCASAACNCESVLSFPPHISS